MVLKESSFKLVLGNITVRLLFAKGVPLAAVDGGMAVRAFRRSDVLRGVIVPPLSEPIVGYIKRRHLVLGKCAHR